jgi:hypothetical protein
MVQWLKVWGLKGREVNLPAEFGKAGHLGLGVYYRQGRALEKGVQAALGYWAQFEQASLEKAREKKETPLYTCGKLEEILRAYHVQFAPLEEKYRYIDSEMEMDLEVPGCPLPVRMKIDLVMENMELNKLAVFEFKFSTSLWRFIDDPNDQGVGYAIGASRKLAIPINRIIYHINEVKVSSKEGIVPAKKKGDPGRSIFKRSIIDLDPWDIEEWERDVRQKEIALQHYEDIGYWPKSTRSCSDWGGCVFAPLCTAPPSMRELFAQANFDVGKDG